MKIEVDMNSLKGLLIHVGIVLGLLSLISFSFFFKILPGLTNKGSEVYVPDLTGLTFEEAIKILDTRDLTYEVSDSAYNSESAPLTVLEHYPTAAARVKTDRKIILRLNAKIPPIIPYPDLTGSTYNLALSQLTSLDLKIGAIEYQQDVADNSILESRVNDKLIQAGQLIPKGSRIDLIVGRDTLKKRDD